MKNRTLPLFFAVALSGFAVAITGCGKDHTAGDEHGGHEDHAGETGDGEEGENGESEVTLTDSQIKLAEIKTAFVSRGDIYIELPLLGEVTLNQDRLVHIVPSVPGVVQRVHKMLGDRVRTGDVMATIRSRELADAKAAYLAAHERVALAQVNFTREEGLWKEKISSKKEYLDAKQALAETRIELRSAEQKLRVLGFSSEYLKTSLLTEPGESFTQYDITAPFDGTIIEKHIAQGEIVGEDADLYALCNLDTVWVIGSVYERDIARIKQGQIAKVRVAAFADRSFAGKVTWIADIMDEHTRTLKIRVEVANRDRLLKPGMFAKIVLGVETKRNVITVPPSAIQTQKGETIVFVAEGGGRFERREVTLGTRTTFKQEVISGLQAGEKVVTSGSFILKSELEKEGFEAGHAH